MNHLRILHNGDLRRDSPAPSPHWMVHVREDGEIWGEYLTPECGRRLPENFRVDLTERFFNIPEALTHHTLETTPHHEEIILALVTPSGHWLCSFTMSELPHESPMRAALDDLLNKLKDWAEQGTGG